MKYAKYMGYIFLGIALLFVCFLLYGTWRRTEAFTTMRGNYPNWDTMKATVKALLEKYYTYDAQKFDSITQTQIYTIGVVSIQRTLNMSSEADVIKLNQTYLDFIFKGIKTAQVDQEKIRQHVLTSINAMSPGFAPNLTTSPIDTHMAVLHGLRNWLTGVINNPASEPILKNVPITQLIDGSLALDAVSLLVRNALLGAYFTIAVEKSLAKPKTPTSSSQAAAAVKRL